MSFFVNYQWFCSHWKSSILAVDLIARLFHVYRHDITSLVIRVKWLIELLQILFCYGITWPDRLFYFSFCVRSPLFLGSLNWHKGCNGLILTHYCMSVLSCCVFQPALGCCRHPKAGPNTFFSCFQSFLFISGVKSLKKVWNEQKSLKTAEKKVFWAAFGCE